VGRENHVLPKWANSAIRSMKERRPFNVIPNSRLIQEQTSGLALTGQRENTVAASARPTAP